MRNILKFMLCFLILVSNDYHVVNEVKAVNNDEKILEVNEYDLMISRKRRKELFGTGENQINTIVSTKRVMNNCI